MAVKKNSSVSVRDFQEAPSQEIQGEVIKDFNSWIIIARELKGNKIKSVIMFTGKTEGPVETVLDQRSFILFGISFGIILGTIMSIFKILKRK
jgi:hypothetical protein